MRKGGRDNGGMGQGPPGSFEPLSFLPELPLGPGSGLSSATVTIAVVAAHAGWPPKLRPVEPA
jgi:hypothetical protein